MAMLLPGSALDSDPIVMLSAPAEVLTPIVTALPPVALAERPMATALSAPVSSLVALALWPMMTASRALVCVFSVSLEPMITVFCSLVSVWLSPMTLLDLLDLLIG